MARPRLQKYVVAGRVPTFLARFSQLILEVEPTETIAECRDPKDDKFLEVAVAAGAEAIISRDLDLLSLHPFRGIPIISPKDFVETWSSQLGNA